MTSVGPSATQDTFAESVPPQPADCKVAAALESAGVTRVDLDRCSHVLDKLAAISGLLSLKGQGFRKVRKAAVLFVETVCPNAPASGPNKGRQEKRQIAKAAGLERKRKRERDIAVQNRCQLRWARVAQLESLRVAAACGEDGALPAKRRIPDGLVAETTVDSLLLGESTAQRCTEDFLIAHRCYVCKAMFTTVHHFYADMCSPCAALNYEKRNAVVDMAGRVCLVTGARVKVGFQICLKLLRMGARVIATTRFRSDALRRFKNEADCAQWLSRLQLVGLDFRFIGAVEDFCTWLLEKEEHLDVVINNAAQTIRRPAAFYKHLLEAEDFRTTLALEGPPLAGAGPPLASAGPASVSCPSSPVATCRSTQPLACTLGCTMPCTSAEASQLRVLQEDELEDDTNFPRGEYDAQGQQLDLRRTNSWAMRLEQVSSRELLEVFFVNAVAPFLLNSRLAPLLRRSPHPDRYIVNVSAMEGKFNRPKTCFHPHTNMAKAALNMLTRTSAADLAQSSNIFMTAVDTGWINDESPLPRALARAERGFQTPLDEIDAAARVLDPVLTGMRSTARFGLPSHSRKQRRLAESQGDPNRGPTFGVFFKDYQPTEW